jgi:hypothetical protein
MIHSSRRERKTKAIVEVLAMLADAHPELVRHRPRGRAAIKDESATVRFDLIKSLNAMDGLPAPKANLIDLRKAIDTAQQQRNELAHSTWMRNSSGELLIRIARGERDNDCGKAVSKSRKVAPEGASYSVELARSLTALIDGAVSGLLEWNEEIVAQRAAQDKRS